MKKLTFILAALFFAVTAVFAQDEVQVSTNTVEIDLAAGTVKSGLSKSIVWDQDSIKITQESRSLNGTTGAAGAVDVTDVSKPQLTDGQNFIFANSSKTFPQITKIEISYEGLNYGGLVVGTTRTGGKTVASASCVTNLSTAENGTHSVQIIGGASTLYVQNYNPTPLHVTKIVVTRAIAGYVEEEEAQTDTATVKTMEEAVAALGTRTKVVVLYENLQPVTKVSSSSYTDYMPDGTTKLSCKFVLPADFDCYGTCARGESGFTFTVDSITNLYAFNNLYLVKSYQDQNSNDPNIQKELNILDPVTVTAVEGENVFIQYNYARNDAMYSHQLVINGEHSLKAGDQIANFAAKFVAATKLTIDDETTQLARSEYFAVPSSSFGNITADNTIKYSNLSNITNLESKAATAVQLPKGGVIAKVKDTYYFVLGNDSVVVRPAADLNIDAFVDKVADLAIKGVIDYCNTATGSKAIIITHIKEVNTNYQTIAEWLQAAFEGEGEGSLANPVIVTYSIYKNNKQYIFIGDETGGLCLTSGAQIDTIRTGDVLTGVRGTLNFSDTKVAPQLSIPNTVQVIDSFQTLEPAVVTIEELLAEENNALNNNIPAIKYANRLVKINKTKRSASFVNGNPRVYGLVQGDYTLPYSTNTLNAYHSKFATTTPMSVTCIIDFRLINTTNLYSFLPRSEEDIQDDFDQPVISPAPGTYYTNDVTVTITCTDELKTNIYYTFDPEIDPTLDECETYEGPIKITQDTTIYYAVKYGELYSKVYVATYKFGATVTTMEELKAHEGERVLYKGLEPNAVTIGEGWMSYTEYFMPDGETAMTCDLYPIPAKMDVYGTLTEEGFAIDEVATIYSFFTMNDLMMFMEGATDEQKMASYEIKESVLVTLAGPMNFYVQYEEQGFYGGSTWKGLAAQTGRMTMLSFQPKAGDEITLKGVYNAAMYDEETGNMIQPAFFTVETANLVSENNKLNYTSVELASGLEYISDYYASLCRLSKGGKIVLDNDGNFCYEFDFETWVLTEDGYEQLIGKDSLVLMAAGPIYLDEYLNIDLDKLIVGIIDFDTYTQAPIFYVTELQDSKLYYNTIAELIAAGAQSEYTLTSALRNPVLLTYISYNQWAGYTIFVQDETGAIAVKGLGVLDENDEYTFPYEVAVGDSIVGIEGFTALEASAYMWSGNDYNVELNLTKVADGEITPIDITLADFNADAANVMEAINNGEFFLSEYANKVVRVQELSRVDDPDDEKWPWLVQGEDSIKVSTYYWGDIAVADSIVSLTGIADYTIINGQTASIQPLNPESVVVPTIDNVEYATITDLYVENGMIVLEGEFQIFTITGQNVTNMNGRLANGIYVVRTANAVAKVVIK
ncbi:MAG: chitobiase/beta-hexosaminidase C-terminal domain-containing protein [Paludibacteraceae bacterium]|nr:chitobiase/beta-hexosaminidase C-terminal domain-containing protein [Paludibacteraceae bacterium]